MTKESFDLKLDRASQHLEELKRELSAFANRDIYRAIRLDVTNRKRQELRWKLQFDEAPPEMLPLIVGDLVHNVRTALDHLVVRYVPSRYRHSAFFPICSTKPYDDNEIPLDNEAGKNWALATRGLSPRRLDQVKLLQPFHSPDAATLEYCDEHGIEPNDVQALHFVSRFDNADKHRGPIKVVYGLMNVNMEVSGLDGWSFPPHLANGFCQNGGTIVALDKQAIGSARPSITVRGDVTVAIEVRKEVGVARLPGTLERLIGHGRDIVAAFCKLG
jgi:hypothetical protein